ncbi:hypothetical protein [Oceanospirillum linum]|uniref:Uncharacterized protein n=1 Tax=Oceanospirillum linum TaxID=966 RepID=A0A1T1HER1_OCELI|nr:hypothetical protein [Oceanospirillum linum]OOV88220.1 hypothetical protein BTA35_0201425 [Oceanospirillum linum]SEF48506.1 hypothetical protein SAMN04489856_101292 [Oleiphilus messinensis]SMP02976.1 hypothetical protein SAMN06264348_101293 [Oceanospirillum linum]
MKISKLIKKAETYARSDELKRKEKKKYLKKVIKKLRKHEDKLRQEYDSCTDFEKSRQLKQEIALAYNQRKKGVKILKSLKKKKRDRD